MKKITKCFTMLLAAMMMFLVFATPAQAATAVSDPVKREHTKQVSKLSNYAEYYGWSVELQSGKGDDVKNSVTIANIRNSKYLFTIKVTSTRKGNNVRTSFKIHGRNYELAGIKLSFKKYAVQSDIRKMLKNTAAKKAESLQKYASKYFWQTSEKATFKNCKANHTLTFKNAKYSFKATIRATRKNGKIAISYLRDGYKSSAKAIKDWLGEYHLPYYCAS